MSIVETLVRSLHGHQITVTFLLLVESRFRSQKPFESNVRVLSVSYANMSLSNLWYYQNKETKMFFHKSVLPSQRCTYEKHILLKEAPPPTAFHSACGAFGEEFCKLQMDIHT